MVVSWGNTDLGNEASFVIPGLLAGLVVSWL